MITHKLAFFLEDWDRDVYSGRQIDLDAYRYACKAFRVKEMAVINPEGIEYEFNDQDMKLTEFISFEDFVAAHKDEKIVLLETPWSAPASSRSLGKGGAEADWFVIGPSSGWIPQPPGFDWLIVPQDGRGGLHGQHIATLLLGYLFIERNRR